MTYKLLLQAPSILEWILMAILLTAFIIYLSYQIYWLVIRKKNPEKWENHKKKRKIKDQEDE